jgi:hypothetical protein
MCICAHPICPEKKLLFFVCLKAEIEAKIFGMVTLGQKRYGDPEDGGVEIEKYSILCGHGGACL